MNRTRFIFLNIGHAYDHLFMLLFPTAVLSLHGQFEGSYSELLLLATPGFIAFAAGAIPAGWLADRWSRSGMMAIFFIGINDFGRDVPRNFDNALERKTAVHEGLVKNAYL